MPERGHVNRVCWGLAAVVLSLPFQLPAKCLAEEWGHAAETYVSEADISGGCLAEEEECLFDCECSPVCVWDRETLLGDWGGQRACLAEQGIGWTADVTQFYMGVTHGGLDREFRYAGRGDYYLNLDSAKLGGPQGLFVKLHAEHRFGESLAGSTGSLLPANIAADLPVVDSENLYLTDVVFMQMFSETFGVFAGKLNTLDGDVNAFAHGRGKTQFSNAAFVVTPIGLRTVVYSTLGAGFVVLRDLQPFFTFTVLNATDTTRTSGFDELFADGVVLLPELRLPTNFFDMPGHQLFGASWSSRDYVALNQDPLVVLPQVPIARQSDSWSLYWNCDQYLYLDPMDATRGWGLFGRAGIADDQTNPMAWFLSFGLGGNSTLCGREADTFGAGWFYSHTSTQLAPVLTGLLGGVGDGQGVEVFYNAEITRWFHLTADIQTLMPARLAVNDAFIAGLRGNIAF